MDKIYFPYLDGQDSYMIPRKLQELETCEYGLPVPPQDLWLGYGQNSEEYLRGKIQIQQMTDIINKDGYSMEGRKAMLDFGCGAGRMIRWLKPYADKSEIWGTDISSEHIYWANQYLKPPFNFATTTTVPHLPFEDKYFDFIYAGSVFTHIDDLAEAWFLELRRISSEKCLLYITIHDYHTIEMLDSIYKEQVLAKIMNDIPLYKEHKNNFGMLVGLRGPASQVFYDIDYLRKSINTIFEIVSVNPEAYGYQTALVLKRK